ncbi:hypothetical protein K449DRAFT_192955 [Hypoxylon sp. EC38]|nr:hypothetical protein K449DRAFT_192955 [Hypoxylon sp. EC38]
METISLYTEYICWYIISRVFTFDGFESFIRLLLYLVQYFLTVRLLHHIRIIRFVARNSMLR